MNENVDSIPHPPIVDQEAWRARRVELLGKEKAHTRAGDRLAAERRRLPMVKVDKRYVFAAPEGEVSLLDLFEGRRQLIVYHFMFDPSWDAGCPGCTGFVDSLGDLSPLARRDATFALISRAPLDKLEAYRAQRAWDHRWVSSFGSDFNYDFHATLDPDRRPIDYNYLSQSELEARMGKAFQAGEAHSLSVFFRLGDDVHLTYQTFARGVETLTDTYPILDVTPYGRQEAFEDSPPGWPQQPTYG